MATQKIHVVPHGEGWAVKMAGESEPASVRPTKDEALDAGKTLALKEEGSVVVHRDDGTFDTIIPFREVQEEAEQTLGVAAYATGAESRRRYGPYRHADGEEFEGSLNWTALFAGALAIVAVGCAVRALFRVVTESRGCAEG